MQRVIIITTLLISLCASQVCILNATVDGACPDLTVCNGYSSVTVNQNDNINYTQCSLSLEFDTAQFTTGVFGNLTFNANVVSLENIQVWGNLSILYNVSLNIAATINVNQYAILQTPQINTVLAFNNVNLTCLGLLIYSTSSITLSNSIISIGNVFCTETWQLNSFLQTKPFLYFGYNMQTYNFLPVVNISIGNNTFQASVLTYFADFSTMFITNGTFSLANTTIATSKSLTVANEVQIDQLSTINSNFAGCTNNSGAGKGLLVSNSSNNCSSSGASSSGYGGFGLALNPTACYNDIQFFLFLQHSFPYGTIQQPLVSGSAGSNPNNMCNDSYNGGGVITMQISGNLQLDGSLLVNGQSSNSSDCSAGSAGSINIFASSISGSGLISAAGGASYNSNGQGSGGGVKLWVLTNNTFEGGINVSSGYRTFPNIQKLTADPGNILIENCPAGYFANLVQCQECPAGTFKGILDNSCTACPTNLDLIPSNSSGNTNIQSCFSELEVSDSKQSAKDFIRKIQTIRIFIFIGLVLVFSAVGMLLRKKYKKKKNRLDAEGFNFDKVIEDMNERKIFSQKLKQDKDFKLGDLMYHVHRISAFGSNIYDNPWLLSNEPPEQIVPLILPDNYVRFVHNFNKLVKWKNSEKIILYVAFFVYPLYWFLLIQFKKKKYKAIVKFISLLETNSYDFINRTNLEDKNLVKLKVSKNTDYTICYIDIFKYQSADFKYFTLSNPYIVYLSGQGNFIRPFYLCSTDPFLNALFLIINRNLEQKLVEVYQRSQFVGNLVNKKKREQNSSKLTKFMRQFNRCSCTLDLSSPDSHFIAGMVILIELIKKWNKQFFEQFSLQINLILLVTKFEGNNVIDHQVNILENQNKEQFLEFMEVALEGLKVVDKYDIKFALFVYNPNQNIEEYSSNIVQASLAEKSSFDQTIKSQLNQPLVKRKRVKQKRSFHLSFWRILGFLRYYFISHRNSSMDKYYLQFLQIVLILFDASFVAIWQRWLTYPYIGVDILAPFIGIIWFSSRNSYGVGKVFLILNAMAFLNELVLLVTCLIEWNQSYAMYKVVRLVTLILQISITLIGCRMITYSKKLNNPPLI